MDGETIIRKRSRNLSSKNAKSLPGNLSLYEQPKWDESSNIPPPISASPISNLVDLGYSDRSKEDMILSPSKMNKASFGLLSETSSPSITTTTTTTSHSATKIETTHQAIVAGVLPDSIVSELSLATGLPECEIRSWAACLPAGSTVKVLSKSKIFQMDIIQSFVLSR